MGKANATNLIKDVNTGILVLVSEMLKSTQWSYSYPFNYNIMHGPMFKVLLYASCYNVFIREVLWVVMFV